MFQVSFFLFAYTTSPAAVMKLVVFFRSSKPPYSDVFFSFFLIAYTTSPAAVMKLVVFFRSSNPRTLQCFKSMKIRMKKC